VRQRKVIRIINEWFNYLQFDDEGGLDQNWQINEQRLAMESVSVIHYEAPKGVIDARKRFIDIQRKNSTWEPDFKLLNNLKKVVFER
jgi:hypothetical protein